MYNALFVVVSCFSLMSLCSCRRRIVGFVYQQASSSRLSTWHCPHLLLSAVLRRRRCCAPASAAVGRYLLPHSAQQQTRRTPLMERWDRQTDKPTPDRYIPLRYLSDITVANIAGSFTHKMAAKTSWHRYESNLRHCHRMYRVACMKCCCANRYTLPAYYTGSVNKCSFFTQRCSLIHIKKHWLNHVDIT